MQLPKRLHKIPETKKGQIRRKKKKKQVWGIERGVYNKRKLRNLKVKRCAPPNLILYELRWAAKKKRKGMGKKKTWDGKSASQKKKGAIEEAPLSEKEGKLAQNRNVPPP